LRRVGDTVFRPPRGVKRCLPSAAATVTTPIDPSSTCNSQGRCCLFWRKHKQQERPRATRAGWWRRPLRRAGSTICRLLGYHNTERRFLLRWTLPPLLPAQNPLGNIGGALLVCKAGHGVVVGLHAQPHFQFAPMELCVCSTCSLLWSVTNAGTAPVAAGLAYITRHHQGGH